MSWIHLFQHKIKSKCVCACVHAVVIEVPYCAAQRWSFKKKKIRKARGKGWGEFFVGYLTNGWRLNKSKKVLLEALNGASCYTIRVLHTRCGKWNDWFDVGTTFFWAITNRNTYLRNRHKSNRTVIRIWEWSKLCNFQTLLSHKLAFHKKVNK